MSEDEAEERETMQKMWLAEKVTSLENETVELKKTIQEMEARIGQQEKEITEMTQRNGAIETAIARLMEQLQRQISFNEGVRASFTSLGEEVNKHQNNFREVARIFQAHEEHIIKTGAAYQQMAQCINSLVRESENNTVWISSVMRETQEQTQVLRQHEFGLQVQAEVIKVGYTPIGKLYLGKILFQIEPSEKQNEISNG